MSDTELTLYSLSHTPDEPAPSTEDSDISEARELDALVIIERMAR